MNEAWVHIATVLLRTTVLLAAAAIAVRTLLWLVRPHSPIMHRWAWVCVLLHGLLVMQWTLNVPWYEQPVVSAQRPLDELPQFERQLAGAAAPELVAAAPQRTAVARGWHIPRLFVSLWLVGVVVLPLVALGSYLVLLHSLRAARPARRSWRQQWQELLEEHGVQRPFPLVMHDKLGPMLCRLPRGYCVVVPERLWETFSQAQRQAVLEHELAHYQRGDIWRSLVARLIALPHWFNPFAWWAVHKFEEGGEWACDQQLAASNPQRLPDFARALLEIVEPQSRQICASAARGASLSIRLRRLFAFHTAEDSLMKKCMLFVGLLTLTGLGLLRLNLVAREPAEPAAAAEQEDFEQRVAEFAAQLDTNSDPNLAEFQQALGTPAGRIVLQDRAAHIRAELREQAGNRALPEFFEQRFERQGEQWVLRAGQEAFREELLRTASGFNEDVAGMMPAVHEIAGRIAQTSELNRLVARFLEHDAAPAMLYVEQLRQRLRPDASLIERALGEVFVSDGRGQYFLRPGRRAEAEEFLRQSERVLAAVAQIRDELQLWYEEFADKKEIDKQLKTALGDPLFTTLIASRLLEDADAPLAARINRFFEQLEELAVDTADGLSVREEHRGEVQELLSEYRRLAAVAERLAAPVQLFAAKIRRGDPLEEGWRELLHTDLALLRLGGELELSAADPAEAARMLLGQVLAEGDDGLLHVRTEEPEEEVANFIRELFRMHREVRRRGRVIEQQAEQLADAEVRDALRTLGGKFVFVQMVQRSLRGSQFDGLTVWIEEHFEKSDAGWTLRPGAAEVIREVLADVAQVEKELEKDDF